MDYLLIDGREIKNEIHTVLRTVMRAGVADKITEDIIEVIGGKTIDSGDLGDLMLNQDEIDAVTSTEGEPLLGSAEFNPRLGWVDFTPEFYDHPGFKIMGCLNKAQLKKFRTGTI